MEGVISDLATKLDQPDGHPIGIGVGFFGICIFMILLFLAIIWVGKQRDKRRGPRQAPQLPLLIKRDEERERRRQAGR